MKKLLFLGGVAALSLTACTSEDIIEQNAANEIRFSVQTERGTRATDVFCNNNTHKKFTLYASTNGTNKDFILGDVVSKNENTWENGTKRFWPVEALDFYAFHNEEVNGTSTFDWKAKQFKNFTVNDNVALQNDLIYALTTNQKKEVAGSAEPVALNFRHALSQVVFRAKNTSTCYYIEIYGVSVNNLYNQGTYQFPTVSTTSNIEHGIGVVDKENPSGTQWYEASRGKWNLEGTYDHNYSVGVSEDADNTFQQRNLFMGQNGNLTDVENGVSDSHQTENQFRNAMLLMPQNRPALNLADRKENPAIANNNGTYFVLNCKIWNIADPKTTTDENKDLDKEVVQYEGNIIVPVSIDWKEGYKYIYTFVLGGEGDGWEPDPDEPKPVFVPITFDVTVDEFIPWYNQDAPLDNEKDTPAN